MTKSHYFRTRYLKQRVSGFETLLISVRHDYYRIFPYIRDILSWKKIFLVRSEILGLFVNTLTDDYQYSRHNIQNFPQQIQTQLSQKRKDFLVFLLNFWNLNQVKNIFKKRWAF